MALDPLATIDDLGTWLGVDIGGIDGARADAILTAVSSLVRSEAGRTWEDEPVPEEIVTVTLQVAGRVYRNPQGVAQESTGPFSITYTVAARAGLYLTADEKAIVRRYRGQPRGLWTMPTTRGDHDADTVYVPVEGSDNEFPWYSSLDMP